MSTLSNNLTYTPIGSKLRYTCSLTAENTFTTRTSSTTQSSSGTAGLTLFGDFVVAASGTFVATLVIQRSADDGVTWNDITTGYGTPSTVTLTGPGQIVVNEPCRGILYRVGIKTGGYGSGTVVLAIQQ